MGGVKPNPNPNPTPNPNPEQAKKLGLLSKKGEVGAEAAKAEAAALHSEFHEELSLEDEELVRPYPSPDHSPKP